MGDRAAACAWKGEDGATGGWAFRPCHVDAEGFYASRSVREATEIYFRACGNHLNRHRNFLGFDLGNEINCCWQAENPNEGDAWMDWLLGLCDEISPGRVHVNGIDHQPWFSRNTFSAQALSLLQFNWLDQNIPGSALIAGTDLPTGVKAFQPTPENRWGFFAAADGNFGDVDGETVQSNYSGAGFTAGADYRLNENFTVGLAAGYDYSKTDFDNSGSNVTANSVRLDPYALWQDGGGDWVEGTVGGAYHFYDSHRDTVGGMAQSASGATEFDASLRYGHDFKVNQWTWTPTFGLNYLHLDVGSYSETGSDAPLAIQGQAADSFRSTVGYAFKWKGIAWNPYVQAGWSHELLDATQAINARFASGAGGRREPSGFLPANGAISVRFRRRGDWRPSARRGSGPSRVGRGRGRQCPLRAGRGEGWRGPARVPPAAFPGPRPAVRVLGVLSSWFRIPAHCDSDG